MAPKNPKREDNFEINELLSQQHQVEKRLQIREQQYRNLFENAGDAISVVDEHDQIVDANHSFCKLMGYSHAELLSMSVSDLQAPEDRGKNGHVIRTEFERYGNSVFEVLNIHCDGTRIHVELRVSKVETDQGDLYYCIYRDISQRRTVEKERQKFLNTLTVVLESIDAHIYVADLNTYEILYLNKKMEADFGSDVIGKMCYQVFRNEQFVCSHCSNKKLLDERGEPLGVVVWEGKNPITNRWYVNHDRAIQWHDGRMVRIQISTDLSNQKDIELALRESEERYRKVSELTSDFAYAFSVDGDQVLNSLWVTIGLEKITGFTARELEGRGGWETLIKPEDLHIPQDQLQELLVGKSKKVEYRIICKDGEIAWVQDFAQPVWDDSLDRAVAIYGALQDITERKQGEIWILALNSLRDELLSQNELSQKISMITDQVVESFRSDFCRIWLIKPGDFCESGCIHADLTEGPHMCRSRDQCLHLVASSGRYTHLDGEMHGRVPLNCYKIGRVASGVHEKFVTNDVSNNPEVHDHEWAQKLGLKSFAGYRLTAANGDVLGVLACFSQHVLSDREAALLETLAGIASQVIQAEKIKQDMRESEALYRGLFMDSPCELWEQDHSRIKKFIDHLKEVGVTDFRAYFDENPDAVVDCYCLMRVLRSNQAALNRNNVIDFEEMVEKVEQYSIPETLLSFKEQLIVLAEGSRFYEGEAISQDFSGKLNFSLLRTTIPPDYEDSWERVYLSSIDITAQKQAEQNLKRRVNEMATLHALTLDLTSSNELQPILESIVARAVELLDSSAGGLYLCDAEKRQARNVVSYNTVKDFTGNILHYGEGAAGLVAETGEPLTIDDYRYWDGRAKIYDDEESFQAILSVPILWQGNVEGVIHIMRSVDDIRFTQEDLELLMTLANHAAIAIQNARLLQQIQRHAVDLEESVEDRTTELRILVDAMAGREVRMAELKKVIKQLRNQLADAGMHPVADDPLNEPIGWFNELE